VGDAAGRPKQGTRKKDFSASDYKMAMNAKIGVSVIEGYIVVEYEYILSYEAEYFHVCMCECVNMCVRVV
jgi:hypothetical protein